MQSIEVIMELRQEITEARYQIYSYGSQFIQVNDQKIKHSFIISPTQLINPWGPRSLSDLNPIYINAILELKPSLVLLGVTEPFSFFNPNWEWLSLFYANNIGIEIMNQGAACRTYTVLISEGREVAAAYLLPSQSVPSVEN
jgi:uncharacterized protein